jgi:hypothetical protein
MHVRKIRALKLLSTLAMASVFCIGLSVGDIACAQIIIKGVPPGYNLEKKEPALAVHPSTQAEEYAVEKEKIKEESKQDTNTTHTEPTSRKKLYPAEKRPSSQSSQ